MKASVLVSFLLVAVTDAFSATPIPPATPPPPVESLPLPPSPPRACAPPERVAVAGASGRTGRLVVAELRSRGIRVVALARNVSKATALLPAGDDLEVVACDHLDAADVARCAGGCDAALWCATGFAEPTPPPAPEKEPEPEPENSFLDRLKNLLGLSAPEPPAPEPVPVVEPEGPGPKTSIDLVGVPALAKALAPVRGGDGADGGETDDGDARPLPKVVMLSSAGVTRPAWDAAKKERFPGSAEIPIVRLNPFGILGIKADSEQLLRDSGTPYCIFRPTGLNDDWPAGSRPILSQGDLAVGRIHRSDVAAVLVACLLSPAATGKTFEGSALAGYAPAPSLDGALARLGADADGPPAAAALDATYAALQQILPGEKQDAAALAMGQTYEQLDGGETGRLGKRGEEDAEGPGAAPKPSS